MNELAGKAISYEDIGVKYEKDVAGIASKIAAIDPRNPTRKLKAASSSLSGEPMISSHTEARTTGTEQTNAKTENTVPATLRFEGL